MEKVQQVPKRWQGCWSAAHLEIGREKGLCSIWRQEMKGGLFWMSSTALDRGNRKERARLFWEVHRDSTKDTHQRPKKPVLLQEDAWPKNRDPEKPWDLHSCRSSQLYWTRPGPAWFSWHSFRLHRWWWAKWWIIDYQRSLVNEIILQYYLTASWTLLQLCSLSWNNPLQEVNIPDLKGVVVDVLAELLPWRTNIGKRR